MSPRALAATLPKVTKPALQKHGRAYAALIAEWTNVVGAELAQASLPEKLASTRTGSGVLTIRVAGAAAIELQHLAPQIIERINTYLGFAAVERLKIVHAPLPGARPRAQVHRKPPSPAAARVVDAAVSDVDDAGVRSALARLGRSIMAEDEPLPPAGPATSRPRGGSAR